MELLSLYDIFNKWNVQIKNLLFIPWSVMYWWSWLISLSCILQSFKIFKVAINMQFLIFKLVSNHALQSNFLESGKQIKRLSTELNHFSFPSCSGEQQVYQYICMSYHSYQTYTCSSHQWFMLLWWWASRKRS